MATLSDLSVKAQELVKQSSVDENSVLSLFSDLDDIAISVDELRRTKIGAAVNQLRKRCKDASIAGKGKALVKKWQSLVPGKAKRTSSSDNGAGEKLKDSDAAPPTKKSHTVKDDVEPTGDSIRDMFRKSLCKALQPPGRTAHEDDLDPPVLACEIESAIFQMYGDSRSNEYKRQCRSRIANLKDWVLEHVTAGLLEPSELARMHTQALMTKSRRQALEKHKEKTLHEKTLAFKEGNKTNQLTCPRCKKKDATYTEMQTRSADEPMTVFATCNGCGKRWRQ